MVHEGYLGHVAFKPIALIAPELKGVDLAPVPFALRDEWAFRALDERERLLVRHGHAILFGTPLPGYTECRIHTSSDYLRFSDVRQTWRLVPQGGEAHRAHPGRRPAPRHDGRGRGGRPRGRKALTPSSRGIPDRCTNSSPR